MNFTVGCKEKRGEEWIYYLMDGTALSQEEWSEVIRQHIVENHHENVFKKIKGTVQLWNKHDTVDEVALQVYASRYCTNVTDIIKPEPTFSIVQDEMGCSQLSFY